MEDKISSWAIVILLGVLLSACSTMHTPYDPDFASGEQLIDQIPNSEGEALWRCAGDIPPQERKPYQTGRC